MVKNEKIEDNLTDSVAATLYIPLAMKCKETERKNPFFVDHYSCEIMKKIRYDFKKYNKAIRSSVGVAIRAGYFDKIVKDFIENNHSPVIVILGCGLDTRFLRLGKSVTKKTVFYELDLPEVINLRKKLLSEFENDIYISSSIFETSWIDNLLRKHKNSKFMLVAEGVFMYFETEEVKTVVRNIAGRFSNSKLVFDSVNNWMCKNSYRHDTVKLTNAVFKFGLDDPRQIEKWDSNIKLETEKIYSDFKEWKKTGFFNNIIMRLAPSIKYSSRLLTYNII